MFPELGGDGAPGDADAGTDVSGVRLPDLSPSNDDFAPGTGSSLSSVPSVAADAPAAGQRDVQVEAGTFPASQTRKARTAEERIAQLTRRYRQEEQKNQNVSAQLQQLLEVTQRQSAELTAIRSGRVVQPTAGDLEAEVPGAPPSGPLTLDAVRSVVRDVIVDYDSKRREGDSRIQQMRQAHEASFKEAAEDLPELMDTRSRARQVFDELYSSSPLTQLADGPYQISLQVRGIIADEQRRGQAASPERKLQVGVVMPSPSMSDLPHSEVQAAKVEFAQLTKARRDGNEDFKVYRRWRNLRDFIRVNEGK
jgi:hypothetical protein